MPARPGWHRHHLLPRSVRRYPDLRDFIGGFAELDFWLGDFRSNGMFLPADDSIARIERLPIHRGPHRGYSEKVIDALDRVRTGAARARLSQQGRAAAVRGLQHNIREAIRASAIHGQFVLADVNPFSPTAITEALCRQTDALFARTPPYQLQ